MPNLSKISSAVLLALSAACASVTATEVTYKPYVQPGDASQLSQADQMVVAWQTTESSPNAGAYVVEFGTTQSYGQVANPTGRVVDNYLSADPALPVPTTASGPYSNYVAVLPALKYDQTYYYRVSGPGMPAGGFESSFHTRKRGDHLVFQVMGDEGFFPGVPNSKPPRLANYEARIVNEMYTVHDLRIPGAPRLPKPDLALNTGDNVYTTGAEGSYRDFWFPVWNSDIASNESGAPYLRHIPYYIVAGNHDIGADGATANLLGDNSAGRFSGNTDGGDALAYFNNYYFPLNGPKGVDPQHTFNGDNASSTAWYFKYKGVSYQSPAAIEALRASTEVDTGRGKKRQIDTMGNYSFDSGNVHFVFLDANPHLFNGQLPGGALYQNPPSAFPEYPGILRDWLINDLDASKQPWKVVVYHQPAFSSGNATLRNNQMRHIAKLLEDHGANLVFNGHEHNYQRSLPLRVTGAVAEVPAVGDTPVVAVDTAYDGIAKTVPDGVIYLVEGAGGNRDFDDNLPNPRGGGLGLDQEDSATGTFTFAPGFAFAAGPASWLDDRLTNNQMITFYANAGQGTKITARFKGKVFSFGHVVVDENRLTLFQITEPLSATSSASTAVPAPFGTDVNGMPLNDPIADTLIDPASGEVVSASATGAPALLDKFTVEKPELDDGVKLSLTAPKSVANGASLPYQLKVDNIDGPALNGAQIIVKLPSSCAFAGNSSDTLTAHGNEIVLTLGRIEQGTTRTLQIACTAAGQGQQVLVAKAELRSSTALPVHGPSVETKLISK